MSSQVRRPFVSVDLVQRLLKMHYNFEEIIEVRELSSFSDRNFYIRGRRRQSCCSERQNLNIIEYVLKILNSVDSVDGDFIDAENNAITFLRSRGFPCPLLEPVSNTNSLKVLVQIPLSDHHNAQLIQNDTDKNKNSSSTENCILRLMSFLPGVTASSLELTAKDLFHVGQFVGQLSQTLQEFGSSCLCQKTDRFNIENLPALNPYIASVEGEENKSLVREVLDLFAKHVTPKFQRLRLGTLHNDVSGSNLLVDSSDGRLKITGLVDFGDIRYSFLLSELANTLASFLSEDRGLLDSGYILAGYQSIFPLPGLELDLLYYFVAARLCQVFLITSEHIATKENPKNEYLEKLLVDYRALLKVWCAYPKDDVEETWRGVFSASIEK